MYKLNTFLLLLYFTFSSLSGYAIVLIQSIGKYGKIFVLLITIFFFIILISKQSIKIFKFFKKEYSINYILISFIVGSIYGYSVSNDYIYSLYTMYIILSLIFIIIITVNLNLYQNLFQFFKIIEGIIIIQFLIGIFLIIIFNINLYDISAGGLTHNEGGLSGFLEKRNTFGLLCTVGFFSSFYIYKITKSKKSLFLFIIYLILIYLTKTRFVYIIIFTFFILYIYYSIIAKVHDKYMKTFITIIKFLIVCFLCIFIYLFIINNQEVVYEFTTGRLLVWSLFTKEIQNDTLGFLFGHGSGYFSDLIIDKYAKYNYYISILDNLSLHSSYLKLLETGGIISFIIFIYINYKALKDSNIYIRALIISFLVGGLVESYLMNPNTIASMFYWFIILIHLNKKGF